MNKLFLQNQLPHRDPVSKRSSFSLAIVFLVLISLLVMNIEPTSAQDNSQNTATPVTDTTEAQSITPSPTEEVPLPTLVFPRSTDAPAPAWRPPLAAMPLALSPYDHFYFSRPIGVDSVNWPLPDYLYGYKDSETDTPHSGLDFDAPMHTPILAAGSGKVIFTGYGLALGGGDPKDPYGLAIVIRHDFSFDGYSLLTVYGHMEKITVSVGQNVKQGEQIGNVGMTGNTTGPHVHFEVRLEKDNLHYIQNPELWMIPPTDYGVFVGKFTDANGFFLTSHEVWIKSLTTGKNWTVMTYATQEVPNDPCYLENVALGDLPVGNYEITFYNNYQYNKFDFSISPGAVTFISYKSGVGFSAGVPQPVNSDSFVPPRTH